MIPKSSQRHTILVADDSEMNRSILRSMLEESYDIIEAEDGLQAVRGAQESYQDYWNSHLAVMAPGGVDVYAVNPDFQWGKDEPWSMWQLENGETFWSSSSSAGSSWSMSMRRSLSTPLMPCSAP